MTKIFTTLAALLFIVFPLRSQDTTKSFYFPLNTGNLWQYKEPPPPEDPYITEIRTGKDTTFSNGKIYKIFLTNSYGYPDTAITGYRRQIENKVYEYFPNMQQEALIYDFSKNTGDTVSVFPYSLGDDGYDTSIVTVLDKGVQNIFGTSRRYMVFYRELKHVTLYWIDQIVDSIGITFSQTEPGFQLYLVGAIVDSIRYGTVTSIEQKNKEILGDFILFQNYPNPFNPVTTIAFKVPRGKQVRLIIYNILGESIRTLFKSKGNGEIQSIEWDGKNDSGISVNSGVYFYQIRMQGFSVTRKMLIVR